MEVQLNRTEAAFVAWAENMLERLQDAMAENEGLREALEAVEWIWDERTHYGICPWCDGDGWQGEGEHAPDCQRQIALAREEV